MCVSVKAPSMPPAPEPIPPTPPSVSNATTQQTAPLRQQGKRQAEILLLLQE